MCGASGMLVSAPEVALLDCVVHLGWKGPCARIDSDCMAVCGSRAGASPGGGRSAGGAGGRVRDIGGHSSVARGASGALRAGGPLKGTLKGPVMDR